jgi:catechol 2,3-dioxygenase-like lactoylglutathione lyase family enzyme
MIGYMMFGTNDLARAGAFYDEVLALLGMARTSWTAERYVWYGAGGRADFPMFAITRPWNKSAATVGNGAMIALRAPDRETVDAVHARALALGGSDEGAPGPRSKRFHAGYFRDLDGNKLCVFHITP